MSFKPCVCRDRWIALLVIAGLLAIDALILRFVALRPVDGGSFIASIIVLFTLPILAYVGFRTAGAFTLEYWVDRDAVTIIWGGTRQIVPLTHIERILRGADVTRAAAAGWWHWPCPERSRRRHERLGIVNAYATRPLDKQIILVTADECFGVSPRNAHGFIEAIQTRFSLGTARPLQTVLIRPPLWTWPLWRDRSALVLIGVGLLMLVGMFGILSFRFPGLPSDLPMHFNVYGVPDRISPKSSLLALPIIGVVAWLLNLLAGVWVYRRIQRGGAYLLWGGALVVQLIAGIALINLTRW